MSGMEIADVLKRAIEMAEPSEEERGLVSETARRAMELSRELFRDIPGYRSVSLEGSAAKDTWIKGRAEIDVFIHFSPDTPREKLEEGVVRVGSRVIGEMGGESRLRYADHPYVEGIVGRLTINIVGCYDAEPGRWLSPVDRTPHHTCYVNARLSAEQRREVRLLKSFMMGIGVYGAEIQIEGFSGYLAELLIISHGGFLRLLEAARAWRPPIYIDVEKHLERHVATALFPNSPLIVIDPVDPHRNVASAVSATRLSEFVLASRMFLREPSTRFFHGYAEPSIGEVSPEGRELLLISFRVEGYTPPDILWGEIKRSARGIKRGLEDLGFRVYRHSAYEEDGYIAIIYELESLVLPETTLHVGPPVWLGNAYDFVEKHLGRDDTVAGPWVEDGRLRVLKRREVRDASLALRTRLREGRLSISKKLLEPIKNGRVISGWRDVSEEMNRSEGARSFLRGFLSGRPPFLSQP